MPEDIRIEFPSVGATYHHEEYGVYKYGTYPKGSVLEGEEMRSFLGRFKTLEEAQAAFPAAEYASAHGFREVTLPSTPPKWFDPSYAGESWDDE